jgi:hypothetical protein
MFKADSGSGREPQSSTTALTRIVYNSTGRLMITRRDGLLNIEDNKVIWLWDQIDNRRVMRSTNSYYVSSVGDK